MKQKYQAIQIEIIEYNIKYNIYLKLKYIQLQQSTYTK